MGGISVGTGLSPTDGISSGSAGIYSGSGGLAGGTGAAPAPVVVVTRLVPGVGPAVVSQNFLIPGVGVVYA